MNSHGTIPSRSFFVVSLLLVSFVGCDKLSEFKEYFSSSPKQTVKKPAVSAPQSSTPTTPAVSTPSPSASLPDNVLAQVGNWRITLDEFNDRLKKLKEAVPEYDINSLEAKQLVLEELIRQQLLVADAEQSGVAEQKEIAQAIDEFRRTLLVREVAMKLTKGVEATEAEAQDYYEKNKGALAEPAEWHLREIVANTEVGAKEILIEALKGMDFTQLAKDRSIGKTAANGGDLGFLSEPNPQQAKAQTVPEFMLNEIKTLDAGGISKVFKGPDGFYVVKVEEKKGGVTKEFTEIKNDIVTGLTLLKQQQAILNHLNELSQKMDVKVNEKLLGGAEEPKNP